MRHPVAQAIAHHTKSACSQYCMARRRLHQTPLQLTLSITNLRASSSMLNILCCPRCWLVAHRTTT